MCAVQCHTVSVVSSIVDVTEMYEDPGTADILYVALHSVALYPLHDATGKVDLLGHSEILSVISSISP